MNAPATVAAAGAGLVKQHLIDPEICIRCHSCEAACPVQAIEHDAVNVVVDPGKCNFCMDCIPVCPTGSIDNWRVVASPYSLAEQYSWTELPPQADLPGAPDPDEGGDDAIARLLAEAHAGAGGKPRAPASAARPTVGLYSATRPATARVTGNFRLTADPDHDVRHIILDFGAHPMPVLEGQSIGIIPPGLGPDGKPHTPRLYSISSPRDGERRGFNNLSLTVKRTAGGLCSNYLCDLSLGDEVQVTGPFGATFLMPDDPQARLLMICTGTGSAPFRAFTMRRQRTGLKGDALMFFGARTPESLPYFGPLAKVPDSLLQKHLVFSRLPGAAKEYVQDRMLAERDAIAERLADPRTHVYICGLRGMERGVEAAFRNIAQSIGLSWEAARDAMREDGRYHVETY
jgi:benzoyl-CoA 2,3-dioxygenase component A